MDYAESISDKQHNRKSRRKTTATVHTLMERKKSWKISEHGLTYLDKAENNIHY